MSAGRREREREELRGRILAAAEELFVKEGYQNVSMRRIAARIEYSATAIYHYFRDKAELFACLLEGYQGRLLARMEKVQGQGGDPLAALRAGMRAYTEFGLAHPSWYRLSFMSPPEFEARAYLLEGSKGAALFQGLRDLAGRCIREGLLRPIDAGLAAQVIWAANHGVTSLLIGNPNFPWAERAALVDGVIDCTLRGLAADGSRGARGEA
jgi:AcrR family transcriptional regulator